MLRLPSGALIDATNAQYPPGASFVLEPPAPEDAGYWTRRYLADEETHRLYLTLSKAVTDHLNGEGR